MPAKSIASKFLRITSNGFVPLFDQAKTAAYKLLESQLRELAKGTFHDEVGPDKSLKGKSVAEFLAMIADGETSFLQATEDKASLNLDLNYIDDDIPTAIGLFNPKIFVSPPLIQPHLDGKKLMLKLDLRLELKHMLRPAECVKFLGAIKKKEVEGLFWSFAASKKLDSFGYSCRMFQQDASLFSFDAYETKKLLLAAA
jgi:hypothetical protein